MRKLLGWPLKREREERALWEQLAAEAEAAKNQLAQQLATLQEAAEARPVAKQQQVLEFAQMAADAISLDEAEARALIDERYVNAAGRPTPRSCDMPMVGDRRGARRWPLLNGRPVMARQIMLYSV